MFWEQDEQSQNTSFSCFTAYHTVHKVPFQGRLESHQRILTAKVRIVIGGLRQSRSVKAGSLTTAIDRPNFKLLFVSGMSNRLHTRELCCVYCEPGVINTCVQKWLTSQSQHLRVASDSREVVVAY
jgi:hypothetical protein